MARYIPERSLSQVVVRLAGTKLPVNMMDPVSTLKEQRVVLELKENEFRKVFEIGLDLDRLNINHSRWSRSDRSLTCSKVPLICCGGGETVLAFESVQDQEKAD